MIKLLSKLTTLGLSLMLMSACSDQYKIVNPGATSDEMYQVLDNILNTNSVQGTGFDTNTAQDLMTDPNSTIYFTRSGSNGLSAESVFSMGDATPFTGFGNGPQEYQNVFQLGLSEVSIGLMDARSSNDERHFMLMIEFNYEQEFGYNPAFKAIASPGSYGFSEDVFEVRFEGQGTGGEAIALRTFDLNDDISETLGDNVQFQVYVIDGSGVEYHIGQFSTLAGFGS